MKVQVKITPEVMAWYHLEKKLIPRINNKFKTEGISPYQKGVIQIIIAIESLSLNEEITKEENNGKQ